MDLLLKDKVAVVTGAGRGIGLAITRALSDEGAHVVAGSLTIDRLAGARTRHGGSRSTWPRRRGRPVSWIGQSSTSAGSTCS